MRPIPAGGASFALALEDEAATRRFMVEIANTLEPGDVVTLSGDLGAGKTTFTRALIHHLAGDETISVPSPTFTLMQSYELPRFPLVHVDLYRLSGSSELAELGLDDLPDGTVLVIEWPDRAADWLPADRIDIAFTLVPQSGLEARNVQVTGYGTLQARVDRIAALHRFLAASGYSNAERQRLAGDASTRSYERLTRGGHHAMLMNSPRRPDGPPVHGDKPYSAIAHLAEDVLPFVAMAQGLRAYGFSAPEIYHRDLEHGFLIIEDLGDETVVEGDPPRPIDERYAAAIDMLVALHQQHPPQTLPVAPGVTHSIPPYDLEAFLIEAELLLDWYVPRAGASIATPVREAFVALWSEALQAALAAPPMWVLRDFHSPNLLWLPERDGVARVGLLDFQDALIGPSAYDVASLLQDARVDVPESLELTLLGRYARARRAADPQFDAAEFAALYATLAAQRASKILGIFARLERRDGKPQYLRHMPRVWGYLQRSLAHPALAPLATWYKLYVPAFAGI